ncbi:VanZ like family protein [Natronoarchaeum philippinense]|uniref:VanZ like family protein n=1 Tax=Natronoarchaeum philippinense TaxID=558529 RepID=A0A285P095_NATPI|nr:VanZ family protein [Natronoarchaeum philippinense]SNZ15164.1 VanZ like family protein [Natronoarchaeum philippinense]
MQREVPVPLVPRWARWALVVAAATVIFYASVLAAPPAGPETGPIGFDKFYHAGGYFGLGLAVAYAVLDAERPLAVRLAVVFAVPVAYGVGIEVAQGFVPERALDPIDALANAVGGAAACALYAAVDRLSVLRPVAITGDR